MKSVRVLLFVQSLCLVALICTARHLPGQAPANVNPVRSLDEVWFWLGTEKQVTNRLPSDYGVGAVYRLKQDVVVECGGTSSRVSKYWVSEYEANVVENVREELRDPQATKEREIQTLRDIAARNPKLPL